MITLNRAIAIAVEAHAGQVDKGNQPYILHPLRVMLAMPDDDHRIVAVLHDVIEDSDIQAFDLVREGASPRTIDALDCLTRREGESYPDFIDRVATNRIAVRVKLADLTDNMNILRLPRPLTGRDLERLKKYTIARETLRVAAGCLGLKL